MMLCLLGAFAARNNITDVWLMVIFGIVGYLFERFKFPITPLVLGVILGPLAESSFMTTMISYGNDWTQFFTRPISGPIMAAAILTLLFPAIRHWRHEYKQRRIAAKGRGT